MFGQKSTETVTLTRPQLQAILEIISQIGGVNRSEPWNESNPHSFRTDNRLMFTDYSDNRSEDRQSLNDNSQWVRHNPDLLITDWAKESKDNSKSSSLLMLNENPLHNQLLSPTSSNSSKGDEFRADSVMTNDTSKDSNFRRYARTNDSEFDWDEYHRKQLKTLEYSKALAQQHQDKQRRKIEEQQRKRAEEQLLDKRIEEQQLRMKMDFERERQLIHEKRLSDEKKREAVIAAIERTPIIKKRNFLVDSPTESQPVAAIKPQTRGKEISTQTEEQSSDSRYCDSGTQTDVQLLLQLLSEMNLLTKQKSKSEETLSKKSMSASKPKATNLSKRYKSNLNLSEEKNLLKKELWIKKQNVKGNKGKASSYITDLEDNNEEKKTPNLVKAHNTNPNVRNYHELDPLKRESKTSSSVDTSSPMSIADQKKKRVMSSIELKNKIHFLPQIGVRPHSRKKWYSQDTFDPNFLN